MNTAQEFNRTEAQVRDVEKKVTLGLTEGVEKFVLAHELSHIALNHFGEHFNLEKSLGDENAFLKIKKYRAVATRCDKLARNYHSVITLAFSLMWLPMRVD